jgi:myo-inositol-1(or 4)-monophosphatase
VVEDGAPTAGVIYLPARDKLYVAARGEGARLNGTPLRHSGRTDPKGAQVLAPKPSLDPKRWASAPPLVTRHWRPSLAYRFALVAEGRFDAILTLRDAYEWDIAAGILIAQEAGATVTDRDGRRIVLNSPKGAARGVFGAPPGLHDRLSALYRGARAG